MLANQPEVPSVLDRALAALADLDHRARAAQLAKAIDARAAEPGAAATIAYQLGELYERQLADEDRALEAYRRAFELDPSLRPAGWALRRLLYRRALWPNLAKVITVELGRVTTDDERVSLLFERAIIAGHQGSVDEARVALDAAVRLDPRHQGVLLELERVAARAGDLPAMLDAWDKLAAAIVQPERKIAYWLEVARNDHRRARLALDAAAALAEAIAPLAERIATERLRIADEHGTAAEVDAAIETLVTALSAHGGPAVIRAGEHPHRALARLRDVVALRRRQAQRAKAPAQAWDSLQQALALAPDEPVIIVELIELASELGRYDDGPALALRWRTLESDAQRAAMLSYWCGEAHLGGERRDRIRTLLRSLDEPGLVLLASVVECDALADPARVRVQLDLAATYMAMASAAALGTWLGPPRPNPSDVKDANAAAALYVQAAHLLAYFVGTPAAHDQARDALAKARAVAPANSGMAAAVLEASIELDDTAEHVGDALALIPRTDRITVERALRLAYTHRKIEAVVELERELVRLEPGDVALAWRLESTLADAELAETGDERVALLRRLARDDPSPGRRRAALLAWSRLAPTDASIYAQLRELTPDDELAQGAWIDSLRAGERWTELVAARRAEAAAATERPAVRRALREAAWVLEIALASTAEAAKVYDEWLARVPADRTALEGIARCRAALGEHAAEIAARAAIADLDHTSEASWLHARSLERGDRHADAADIYRALVAGQDESVSAAGAALALGDLAARGGDIGLRVEAAEALARRTTDRRLGATLYEDCGWMYVVALADFERAAESFASALALQPARHGALLGAALVAARLGDVAQLGTVCAELATTVEMPEASVALLLRAAACAAANGNAELARQRADAARLAAPDNVDVVFVAVELGPPTSAEPGDPFAAGDRLLARAALVQQRAALVDDPKARSSWELDRAEALELGSQPREASAAIAAVLEIEPTDRRALAALRRIAQRAGDRSMVAQTSYAIAQVSHDREQKLRMLRDAADVFDHGGPASNVGHALAVYRRIVAIDPGAAEGERVLEILRERGDPAHVVEALTDQLSWLATATPRDDTRMVAQLVERSGLLRGLGRRDEAAADLDAILQHAPAHAEALRLRAELAMDAGDSDRAVTLWWRYLAAETAGPRRTEVEQMLARVLDEGVAPPPPPPEPATEVRPWKPEPTQPDAEATVSMPRRSASIIRREPTQAPDPFGGTTVLVDLSVLQAQERRVADEYEIEVTSPDAVAIDLSHVGGLSVAVPPIEVTANSAIAAAVGASDPRPIADRKLRPPPLDPLQDAPAQGPAREPILDPRAVRFADEPQLSPDDSDVVMLSFDQLQPVRSVEASSDLLRMYEREVAASADPASSIAVRLEAGRLAESLGDTERARAHYDAAVLADPRAAPALRGLRRIARASGDIDEVTRLVDAELAIAGPREQPVLARHRIDLLMATGEQDVARVAVGEVLDRSPNDVRALLAHLELAFLDERSDELTKALEQLADAVTDPGLRGAARAARGVLAAHHGDQAAAAAWFKAAAEADPDSPAIQLAAIRRAAAHGERAAAGAALLDLACHIEGEDPITAAALAIRAQWWTADDDDTLAEAAQLATRAAPRDPLVARIATETAGGNRSFASVAFARWARGKSTPVERAYAAARAAELDPARLGRLWTQVLELDPDDDYAAARLRAAHVAAGESNAAIELDLEVARATGRVAPLLRAAAALIDDNQAAEAIDVLKPRAGSLAVALALATAYARAGRWSECAAIYAEPDVLEGDLARWRAALALEHAAAAAAPAEREAGIVAALDAWELVLEDDPRAPIAHGAAIRLATELGDAAISIDVLTRAQAAERSPWAASSLALSRARLLWRSDPQLAYDVARAAAPGLDDPRRTLVVMLAAAQRKELGQAATALEDRAAQLEPGDPSVEAATLRLRAAQLALDADDPKRALALLARVAPVIPGLVDDLLDVAQRRTGLPPARRASESFTRVLRDADLAAGRGERATALELYQRAFELRPTDPLASAPLVRIAVALRDPLPISALALELLRSAEATGEARAKAEAYELLARVDRDFRGDAPSAQIALESACRADPSRLDLVHRLARELASAKTVRELWQLRLREIDLATQAAADPRDRAALLMDAATLAVRDRRPDAILAELYRAALAVDPDDRLALLHLDAILRRGGPADELAAFEERIANHFTDPPMRAAFLTGAGETLARLGKPAEAVKRFAAAADALPGYAPALEAWQETALAHELWFELADAATREAAHASSPAAAAALHHLAGVALMDRARAKDPAIASLRRALEADPSHHDAFVRLRGFYEHDDHRDELSALLGRRLEVEPDPAAQVELHRTLAEHYRTNDDRDDTMRHYRAMLAIDPTDVRAHAAIADIRSEDGDWREAAAAVLARIPLERDTRILYSLHYRLGSIYAAHDVAKATAELQRALTCKPGDEDALVKLTDLAIGAADWQLAQSTCNQLMTTTRDPERRAQHFHRAATIFARGFADADRAERMLELAFESAPTSTTGLQLLVAHFADDAAAQREHLVKIADAMRARVARDPSDGPAYRILARAVTGPAARAASELAHVLGASGEPERRAIAEPVVLGHPDEARLFAGSAGPELCKMLRLAAPALVKLFGVDVGAYGVGRKERVHASDPIASIVRELATRAGFKDVHVYVSARHPHVMVAEPTHPVSVVLGTAITGTGSDIRFAAGAALELARLSLAIPARLSLGELGVLGLALLHLFRGELSSSDVDLDQVRALLPKLRRQLSTSVLDQLRPLAAQARGFSRDALAQDLAVIAFRAGFVASGTVLPGLALLAASAGAKLQDILSEPVAQGLIQFALG